MIDHNVMRLHVAVHYALAVAKVERLEEFVDVEAHVEVVELWIEAAKVGVVDILEDERRRLALRGSARRRRWQSGERPTWESRTTSSRATTLGPPARFCRILISRLIFFFLTGLRTLTTHFW